MTGRFLNNRIIISIPFMYNVHDVLMTVPCLYLVERERERERKRERERERERVCKREAIGKENYKK